jgi:hypothetical protein
MITTATQTSLRDAMYAMSLAKAVPDAELLDEFARLYPKYADALTEFAIELAIDSLMHRSDEEDVPADADAISDVVSRVMSQFENQLFERRQAPGAPTPPRPPAPRRLPWKTPLQRSIGKDFVLSYHSSTSTALSFRSCGIGR